MKSAVLSPLFLFLLIFYSYQAIAQETSQIETLDKALNQMVSEHMDKAGLVGLGSMILRNGEIIASAVSGDRKKGSGVSLTDKDQWHIGSITKSFTATMIARLVEKGNIKWNSSIKDIFPEVQELNGAWHKVTFEQLLTHTSGAPSNFSFFTNFKKPAEGSERMAARESAVLSVLKNAPETTPGSTFTYSNVGFTIAGVMAERITGLPWETLIRQEIFIPLQIDSGGFGPPQDIKGNLEQPRGHSKFLGFTIAAGTEDDNTPILGPAGTIHLTMTDLLSYAKEHLQGAKGQGTLLNKNTYQRLHNPALNGYAYGWLVSPPQEWAKGPVIWHNGSNTMWYALLAIMPGLNTAIAVTSNDGNIGGAESSAWEIIKQSSLMLHNDNYKSSEQ